MFQDLFVLLLPLTPKNFKALPATGCVAGRHVLMILRAGSRKVHRPGGSLLQVRSLLFIR